MARLKPCPFKTGFMQPVLTCGVPGSDGGNWDGKVRGAKRISAPRARKCLSKSKAAEPVYSVACCRNCCPIQQLQVISVRRFHVHYRREIRHSELRAMPGHAKLACAINSSLHKGLSPYTNFPYLDRDHHLPALTYSNLVPGIARV